MQRFTTFLILLAAGMLLSACNTAAEITFTPTISPGLTLTPSHTQTPTQMPSATASPSRQPSATATANATASPTPTHTERTAYPTATPFVPTIQADATYTLVDWTPQLAKQIVTNLESYTGIIGRAYDRDSTFGDDSIPYSIAFVQSEALLRFDESQLSESWHWKRAYSLIENNLSGVNQAYAALLQEELESGQTTIEGLPAWFASKEPRLQLSLIPVEVPSGYLIQISDDFYIRGDHDSGIYLWWTGKFRSTIYPLTSDGDFNPDDAYELRYSFLDVNGDKIPEIITEHIFLDQRWMVYYRSFDIYDVSKTPPRQIQFLPSYDTSWYESYTILPDEGNGPGILFDYAYSYCKVIHYQEEYRLINGDLILVRESHLTPEQIAREHTGTEEYNQCVDWFIRDGYSSLFLVDMDNFDLLLENYPYSHVEGFPWDEVPTIAERDKLRFEIVLRLLQDGKTELAMQRLQELLDAPADPAGYWVVSALKFMQVYQSAGDLVRACSVSQTCYEFFDIHYLVDMYRYEEGGIGIVDYLKINGVPILDDRAVDFNQDGQDEYWIEIDGKYHTSAYLLFRWKDGFVTEDFDDNKDALTIIKIEPSQNFPVLLITTQHTTYAFYRNSDTTKPTVQIFRSYVSNQIYSEMKEIEESYINGQSPVAMKEDLLALEPYIAAVSPEPEEIPEGWEMPQQAKWYYLMGLAYELSGEPEAAIECYLTLWHDFPYSPFAAIAAMKLTPGE